MTPHLNKQLGPLHLHNFPGASCEFLSSPPLLCLQLSPHLPGSLLVKLTNAFPRSIILFPPSIFLHFPNPTTTNIALRCRMNKTAILLIFSLAIAAVAGFQDDPIELRRSCTCAGGTTCCCALSWLDCQAWLCCGSGSQCITEGREGHCSAPQCQLPAAWTTAALSVARMAHAATSLPNQGLAIFAGGWLSGM